jgi:hypothetical protein
MEWAERRNVRLEYIQPGKPQQNANTVICFVATAPEGAFYTH